MTLAQNRWLNYAPIYNKNKQVTLLNLAETATLGTNLLKSHNSSKVQIISINKYYRLSKRLAYIYI